MSFLLKLTSSGGSTQVENSQPTFDPRKRHAELDEEIEAMRYTLFEADWNESMEKMEKIEQKIKTELSYFKSDKYNTYSQEEIDDIRIDFESLLKYRCQTNRNLIEKSRHSRPRTRSTEKSFHHLAASVMQPASDLYKYVRSEGNSPKSESPLDSI